MFTRYIYGCSHRRFRKHFEKLQVLHSSTPSNHTASLHANFTGQTAASSKHCTRDNSVTMTVETSTDGATTLDFIVCAKFSFFLHCVHGYISIYVHKLCTCVAIESKATCPLNTLAYMCINYAPV